MANLVTQITESLDLNGSGRGGTNVKTTQDIDGVVERTLTSFAGTKTVIATFAAQPSDSPSAIDLDRTRYVRVTNLSETQSVNLSIVGVNTNSVLLPPLGSFVINGAFSIFSGTSNGVSTRPINNILNVVIENESEINANIELFVAVAAYVAPE